MIYDIRLEGEWDLLGWGSVFDLQTGQFRGQKKIIVLGIFGFEIKELEQ